MKNWKINIIVFGLIAISLLSSKADKAKQTLRWGLVGIQNEFVADETEITVAEWMEYMQHYELDSFPTLHQVHKKIKHLEATERHKLLNQTIPKERFPLVEITSKLSYHQLLTSREDLAIYSIKDGSHGPAILALNKAVVSQLSQQQFRDILNLPIVGVSYQQAKAYCSWRTERDKRYLSYVKKRGLYDLKYHDIYEYHLPTLDEFARINPERDSIVNIEGKHASTFNYRNSLTFTTKYPYSAYGKSAITPWNKKIENSFSKDNPFSGLSHVQGNVAEMCSIEGLSLGGSFMHYAKQSYSGNSIAYEKEQVWLGFRCVGKRL